MFKLTPLQWLIHLVVVALFGMAIFALTREYYIRHPVRPAVTQTGHAASAPPAALEPASAIPSSISETDPILLGQRADEALGAGRFVEAVGLYRRVLELTPGDVETENDLGLALHYTGDNSAALEVLRKGTAAGPNAQRIWLTRGFVALASGQRDEAIESLKHARDLGPDTPIGKEAARLIAVADQPESAAAPASAAPK
jgi:Flp pilus assembly protein TadD